MQLISLATALILQHRLPLSGQKVGASESYPKNLSSEWAFASWFVAFALIG